VRAPASPRYSACAVNSLLDDQFISRLGPVPRSLRVPVNETELHLLEWGAADSPPVLLVHGMRGHARWFSTVGPALGSRYRALALDLRGHGESAHTPPYGHAVYASDVVALADALELGRFVLLGHSMGGGVAVRAAARLGARLAALVIVDSALGPPPRPALARAQSEAEEPTYATFSSFEEARARFKLRPGDTVAAPELLDHLAWHAIVRRADGQFAWRFDPNLRQRGPITPGAPDGSAIRCPVISIWGARSPMLMRVDPRDIGERFPSAKLTAAEMIPGAHHHVFLDQPDAFNAVLIKWLTTLHA
jgi:pimeloyl-ACP methyl ester carboxylesterase